MNDIAKPEATGTACSREGCTERVAKVYCEVHDPRLSASVSMFVTIFIAFCAGTSGYILGLPARVSDRYPQIAPGAFYINAVRVGDEYLDPDTNVICTASGLRVWCDSESVKRREDAERAERQSKDDAALVAMAHRRACALCADGAVDGGR